MTQKKNSTPSTKVAAKASQNKTSKAASNKKKYSAYQDTSKGPVQLD